MRIRERPGADELARLERRGAGLRGEHFHEVGERKEGAVEDVGADTSVDRLVFFLQHGFDCWKGGREPRNLRNGNPLADEQAAVQAVARRTVRELELPA